MATATTTIRLQKYLANQGLCSRRRAETWITQGFVQVNGQTITHMGVTIDPSCDTVQVHGRLIEPITTLRYYLIHKPLGLISTCTDPQGRPTVLSLLPLTERQGLYPVGRLDRDSSGALLMTNDGALTQKLTHPSHHLWKTYHVLVEGIPTPTRLGHWCRGLVLEGTMTLPAHVRILSTQGGNAWLEVQISEGRNRQIRRVAELLGYPVKSLQRVAIGPLQLENLPPGQFRALRSSEVTQLHRACCSPHDLNA
jgi:pseudouridine synthase